MMPQYLAIKRRASGPSGVLPDGRFLRAVLRRCGEGLGGARHRADQARPASRRRHQDVRRAGAQPRGLPVAADPPELQGRGVRADRGSGRSQEARRQVGGRARRGAGHHAGHPDRGRAARCAQPQLPGARSSEAQGDLALAWLDLSTADFCGPAPAAAARSPPPLARLAPGELLVPDRLLAREPISGRAGGGGIPS